MLRSSKVSKKSKIIRNFWRNQKYRRILGMVLFIGIVYMTYSQFFISYSEAITAPVVSSISPSSGPSIGGTPFTITGSNFQNNATVTINGKSATNVLVLNSTTITGVTPEGYAGEFNNTQQVSKTQPVIVNNTDSSATSTSASNSINFTYYSNMGQILKSSNADFNLGTTSNLVSSGINLNSGDFQWLSTNESSFVTECGYQTGVYTGKGDIDCTGSGTVSLTGGGLADGGYRYQVTAIDKNGVESLPSPLSECIIMNGASSQGVIQISWRQVPGAYGYKVYRTSETDATCNAMNYGTQQKPWGLVGIINSNTGLVSPSNSTVKFDDIATNTNQNITAPTSNNTNNGLSLGKTKEGISNTKSAFYLYYCGASQLSKTALTADLCFYIANPPTPFVVMWGTEQVCVTSIASGSTYNIARGCNATTATTHATSTSMYVLSQPLSVTNYSNFPSSGSFTISIDGEYMTVTAGAGTGNWTVSRAAWNSVGGTFYSGDLIYYINPSVSSGSALPANVGNGALALKRVDGKYLVSAGSNSNNTIIYDPAQNGSSSAAVLGPSTPSTTGIGSNAIQRADNNYLIVNGNNSSSTSIYNYYETSNPSTTYISVASSASTSGSPDTITVNSSTGYPTASNGSNQFFICVGANVSTCAGGEEMLVTNISGNTWSVIRGVNGFTASSHAVNSTVSSFQIMSGPTLPTSCSAGTFVIRPSSSLGFIFCGGTQSIIKYNGSSANSSVATDPNSFPVGIGVGAHASYISADSTFMITYPASAANPTSVYILKFNPTTDTLVTALTTGTTYSLSNGGYYNSSLTGFGQGSIGLPNLSGLQTLLYGQATVRAGNLDLISATNATNNPLIQTFCNANGTYNATYNPSSVKCTQSNGIPGLDNTSNLFYPGSYAPSTNMGYGSLALQMPNGDFLITFGGGATGSNIYNATSATFYNSGSLINLPTGSATGGGTGGSLALPENNGSYFIIQGGATSNTYNVNLGWNYSSSSNGTYTSEAISRPDWQSWNQISWQKGLNGGIQSSEGTDGDIEIATTDYSGSACRPVTSTATTLNGNITSGANSINVSSSTGWPQSGNFYIEVSNGTNMEQMLVTGGQGTTTWQVTRGQNGTLGFGFSTGATVNPYIEVANGTSISGATTPCLFEKVTFQRTAGINSTTDIPSNSQPDKGGPGVIQSGEQTYENRQYPIPILNTLTATYNSQLTSQTGVIANYSSGCGSSSVGSSDSTVCVTPNSGSTFPLATNGSNQFFITVDSEQMLVTNTSGNTWTVVRGVNNTSKATHAYNATVTYSYVYNIPPSTISTPTASTLSQYSSSPTAQSTITTNKTTYWDTSASDPCIDNVSTTLYIMNTSGFPTTSGYYIAVGNQTSTAEIMQVTGITTATISSNGNPGITVAQLTVLRGQLGTSALSHNCNQIASFGGKTLYQYGLSQQNPIILSAPVFSANATDKLQIEAEIQPLGTAFIGTPNYTGDSASWSCIDTAIGCSQISSIYINSSKLASGNYHWQVRVKNSYGKTSSWQSYGTGYGSDFSVVAGNSLLRGGKTISQKIIADAGGATATLGGGISSKTQTNITVTSTTGFPTNGNFYITISGEQMLVIDQNGSNWTVIRGTNGTATNSSVSIGATITGNSAVTNLCLVASYCNSVGQTTIGGSTQISTSATTIPVTSTIGMPLSGGYYITIDSEQMYVISGQGTSTLTVSRAQNGTTAATHNVGAIVYVR